MSDYRKLAVTYDQCRILAEQSDAPCQSAEQCALNWPDEFVHDTVFRRRGVELCEVEWTWSALFRNWFS